MCVSESLLQCDMKVMCILGDLENSRNHWVHLFYTQFYLLNSKIYTQNGLCPGKKNIFWTEKRQWLILLIFEPCQQISLDLLLKS